MITESLEILLWFSFFFFPFFFYLFIYGGSCMLTTIWLQTLDRSGFILNMHFENIQCHRSSLKIICKKIVDASNLFASYLAKESQRMSALVGSNSSRAQTPWKNVDKCHALRHRKGEVWNLEVSSTRGGRSRENRSKLSSDHDRSY